MSDAEGTGPDPRWWLAAIVDSATDAIISKRLDGTILTWNPAAETMFGYSAEEAVGKNITMLIPEDRKDEESKILERIGRGERVEHYETIRLRRQGGFFPVSLTISPIKNAEGRVVAASKIARDITERKQAQESLQEANEQLEVRVQERTAALEAANRELDAFSHSVSHDLRAPLRHVMGFVDLLVREAGDQLTPDARRYMKVIADASREMGELIDDLLAFSRMGRAEMIEKTVDMDALVQDTVRHLEPATHYRNIVWKIPPLPAVQADPAMLALVLTNLLGNAVKFTRPRDPAQIEIGCAGTENERIILFVRDNGVGYDPQYAHKLFGVFQRLHGSDEFEGTGIGLANVRRIIERHGGRTWAEGKTDQGATFYFTLKAATRESEQQP